jgi:hypothetical protein
MDASSIPTNNPFSSHEKTPRQKTTRSNREIKKHTKGRQEPQVVSTEMSSHRLSSEAGGWCGSGRERQRSGAPHVSCSGRRGGLEGPLVDWAVGHDLGWPVPRREKSKNAEKTRAHMRYKCKPPPMRCHATRNPSKAPIHRERKKSLSRQDVSRDLLVPLSLSSCRTG